MAASKYFPAGTVFGRQDGMSQAQIKALEWMYSVKTTTKSVRANLVLFWANGSMMFRSNKTIRRGDKFVLLEDDAVKRLKKKASNDESDSEQEISEESDGWKRFTCKMCSMVFLNAPALKEHKKKHGPSIKMHPCDQCIRSFVYLTSLEAHLKDDHKKDEEKPSKKTPQKMYKCDDCGRVFRWETSYDDHRAVHRKDFVCKICRKVFGKKIFLENHAMTHKKDKNKRSKDGEKVVEVVDVSSDEEKTEESEESESEQPKLRRGKRARKMVTSRSPVKRNRRENAKKTRQSLKMSATKYFPVGTVFGLRDGMSQAQIKALEWMYSVKRTTKSVEANLESFWDNGSMMFRSNKIIRRGDKFVLLDDDDESDSEQEISEESDEEEAAQDIPEPTPAKCVVCLTGGRTTLMLPCAHGYFCTDCAGRIMADAQLERTTPRCPYCRKDIESTLRIYV